VVSKARDGVSVPFLDLAPVHRPLKDAIVADVAELIASGAFTNGPQVAEFEQAFARYCGTDFCVGLASGLDALRLGLLAAGLQPGDEVIVPALTFIATFEAVTQAGGVPVVVDVTEDDYCLDAAAVESAISDRTRVLLPVHLYGQLANVTALADIARRYRVELLEDACQAHGAERDGFRAGATGIAGAFSFYPTKNLGAMGDAGALVTHDAALAAEVRVLREHGQRTKYDHREPGWTARLDTIQAIALAHKLPLLDRWNDDRRRIAADYTSALEGVGDLGLPPVAANSGSVWHLYVVRTGDPARLADYLRRRGIHTGRHYPEPVHLSKAYAPLGYGPGSFPVAEAVAQNSLSLPLFPGMTEAQVDAVVEGIESFFREFP
jgi:dTDP-4-amino-4,6-dideoxygalactose transaminase